MQDRGMYEFRLMAMDSLDITCTHHSVRIAGGAGKGACHEESNDL